MYDQNMKISSSHEWAKIEGNVATIGITHHAQELLGDLVFVELPKVGTTISAGNTVGVIESVKAASDLYSPLSGEVAEVNNAVVNDPTIINQDPHHSGWLFKLKPSNLAELDQLMDNETYTLSL